MATSTPRRRRLLIRLRLFLPTAGYAPGLQGTHPPFGPQGTQGRVGWCGVRRALPDCRVRFEPQGTQRGSRTAGYAARVPGCRVRTHSLDRRVRKEGSGGGGVQRSSQTAGYAARFPGCRVRTHPLDRRVRRGGLPGAVGVPLLAVSPFLNFPIVKRGKSFRTWTSTRAPRASLCIEPGGYM